MPEMPEVETIRRGLQEVLVGRKISAVDVLYSNSFTATDGLRRTDVLGASVVNIQRFAKVLVFNLVKDRRAMAIVTHLKMTGQLVWRASAQPCASRALQHARTTPAVAHSSTPAPAPPAPAPPAPAPAPAPPAAPAPVCAPASSFGGGHPTDSLIGHLPDSSTRVILELDDGSHLYFNDQRKFGWMRLMPAEAVESVPFIAKLGAEPQLSNSHAQWDSVQLEMVMSAPDDEPTHPTTPVTPAEASFLYRARRHPRALIKSVLLDQSVVGGIGNIYADESLWMAKVHPETRVADLHDHELLNIWGAAASVMALSVELGGSTDRNYVNAKGERGAYLDFANVFRREGRPCKRCQKYPIHPRIIKIRVAGRGTHICIRCQELRGVTSFRVE